MPLVRHTKWGGWWRCDHKGAYKKTHYSIHGKILGEAMWCPWCQGWVDRMEGK